MPKIKFIVGLHRTKVRPWDGHLNEVLSEILSYELPKRKAYHVSAHNPSWGPPKRFQSMVHASGSFKTGLLADALQAFKTDARLSEYEYEIDIRKPKPVLDVDGAIERLDAIPYTPRPYQMEAIFTAIEQGRGVIAIPTGGGKSVVLAGVAAALNLKTLIVVDSEDLARQLQREVEAATGVKTGRLWAGTPARELDCQFVVCLRTTLARRLDEGGAVFGPWGKSVGCIIVDECHHVTNDSYDTIFDNLPNATYRFGFTATPEGSSYDGEDGVVQNTMLIKANLGPVIFRLHMKQLIKEGWLAKPEIHLIKNVPTTELVSTDYHTETDIHIVNNEERNHMGCKLAFEAYERGDNVIVFVKRVAHGTIVKHMLLKMGVDPAEIAYISGESESKKRKEEIQNFAEGKTKILIGTVLTEGLNFVVSTGVNLGGGRSGRYIVQALGRVLRKPKPTGGDVDVVAERHVLFYDFMDGGHIVRNMTGKIIHPILRKHGKLRLERYQLEGHPIKIVEPPTIPDQGYSL